MLYINFSYGLVVILVSFTKPSVCVSDYKMEKVLILSRHNVRTPLSANLKDILPDKVWPNWGRAVGELTQSGANLERNMGAYIKDWAVYENLIPNLCPEKDTVYIYANTRQRTMATAEAFVDGAFDKCENVKVEFNAATIKDNQMDPIFHPAIRNETDIFDKLAKNAMEAKLRTINVESSYDVLDKIIDFKTKICKSDCNKNKIVLTVGKEPKLSGPMNLADSMIDAFLMSYYEGMPNENVAWGAINGAKDMESLVRINNERHNVLFNTTIVSDEVSQPLLHFLHDTLHKDNKISILFGHDSNLISLMSIMNIKGHPLPEQFEVTPIGGKLMFQKWKNTKTEQDFLKIVYLYQKPLDMRNGNKPTLEKPPMTHTMTLTSCESDSNGFCSWDRFMEILSGLLH